MHRRPQRYLRSNGGVGAVAEPRAALPQRSHIQAVKDRIGGHEGKPLDLGLRRQQSIERIAMSADHEPGVASVLKAEREWLETMLGHDSSKVV